MHPLPGGIVLLLIFLFVGAPAHAGLEGSPHDLIAQGYDVVRESPLQWRCTRCHISSALQSFGPLVPPVLERTYGAGSLTCFSCHDGTTIVSPDVDASRTAFHPASHGNGLAVFEGPSGEAAARPAVQGKRVECVTCHNPHDNARRPFLRADVRELCLSCHSQYAEFGQGQENRTGNHVLGIDPAKSPRAEIPLQVADAFRTPYSPPYPLEKGKGAGTWHWDLGGHLSGGGSGEVDCGTCHAVHGDEAAPPTKGQLAVDPVNEVANLFCEGCHAGKRADGKTAPARPNPGGTTTGRTYHPVDDDEANGVGRSLEIREPAGWPFGGGTPRVLLCTTCHAAHGALARTPLQRPPVAALGFCEECHEKLPGNHHPAGVVSSANCGSQLPTQANGIAGRLVCASCHRAHNAGFGQKRESDYVPLLHAPVGTGELCQRCHPAANPTCGTDPERQATHFLGDPTLEGTYLDAAPPKRVEPWPESGLSSTYGDNGNTMTCLSCHSFSPRALVSGDDGTSRNLLARSGNGQEWKPEEEATYLCTGCHGGQPGTAKGPIDSEEKKKKHTHPLLEADTQSLGREPAAPLSKTATGKMNCESCHRVHNAATKGGVYILETVSGENADPLTIHPKIDFTVLCHGCHDKY